MSGIRPAAVANMFYPGNPAQLRMEVDEMLADVGSSTSTPKAIIVPHAGYIYSGAVAGYTFRALKESVKAGQRLDTIVVLGFSHRQGFDGVALMDGKAIRTPLGEMEIEEIIKMDYKEFEFSGEKYGIGVIETTNPDYIFGRKDEVVETGPGAGQQIHIDKIGHIQETGHGCPLVVGKILLPV